MYRWVEYSKKETKIQGYDDNIGLIMTERKIDTTLEGGRNLMNQWMLLKQIFLEDFQTMLACWTCQMGWISVTSMFSTFIGMNKG